MLNSAAPRTMPAATRRAHITEEAHKIFLIAPGIRNGGEDRIKKGNDKIGRRQRKTIQRRIDECMPEKRDVIALEDVMGGSDKINREKSGGDDQVIDRIGPVVHGPAIDDFFGSRDGHRTPLQTNTSITSPTTIR